MVAGEDVDGYRFSGTTTEMPECFTDWVRDNRERIARAKSMPYFIADNYVDGNPGKGLRWEVPEKAKSASFAEQTGKGKSATIAEPGKAAKAGNLAQAAVDKLQYIAEHGTPTPRIANHGASGGGVVGATPKEIQQRTVLFNKLLKSQKFKNIEFNPSNGALKAAHVEHNFDKVGGQYELQAQNAGFKAGHAVIFGKEDGVKKGKRYVEGWWNGLRFEVTGCETASSNNLVHGLTHCASKPHTEVAVLVFPKGGFDVSVLQRSIGRFKGLAKSNPKQYHQFKRVICVQGDEIVYDEVF